MMLDTTKANAHALMNAMEERGFVADMDGTTVAFVIEDYEDCSAPATAKLTNGGRVAQVTINGIFAGTQAYSTIDDLADTLAAAYTNGEL